MNFFDYLFCLFAVIPLWIEFHKTTNPAYYINLSNAISNNPKELTKEMLSFWFSEMAYLIWCLFGLFTLNQYVIAGLVLFGFVPFKHKYKAFMRLDGIIGFVCVLFVILNTVTYKIPLNIFTK